MLYCISKQVSGEIRKDCSSLFQNLAEYEKCS